MNTNIYFKSILEKNVFIDLKSVNNNLDNNILAILKDNFEGKCTNDGYIKRETIKIITYSSGIIIDKNIKFNIVFECMICYPVEGMKIQCIIKNITKAGLRCMIEDDNSPLIIFVARDHHYINSEFNNLKEEDKINVKIIGQRFELNDPHICVISEFIEKDINQPIIGEQSEKTVKSSKEKKKTKLKILKD